MNPTARASWMHLSHKYYYPTFLNCLIWARATALNVSGINWCPWEAHSLKGETESINNYLTQTSYTVISIIKEYFWRKWNLSCIKWQAAIKGRNQGKDFRQRYLLLWKHRGMRLCNILGELARTKDESEEVSEVIAGEVHKG